MTEERRKENKFILYTDIVGHTKMFGRLGAAFRPMRERHDEMFQQAIRTHAPSAIVQGSGDGFFAATDDVGAAIEAALAFRRALVTEDWGRFLPPEKRTPDNLIKARVGLHVGLVNVFYRDGVGKDFDGPPRTVAEKVMSMAVGNQVLLTRAVRDQGLLNLTRRDELDFKRFGEFLMRGLADTVEVWAIGEPDMPVGPRPVQPPEHRVIVFSTIHEFSSMNEKMGPDFDPMKDVWDACFAEAVLANSKDAFIKRLPDGSLAAFKNAMDATRAARDFRRGFKLKTKNAMVRFEPKIALDSGLVTFDYENNRSVDVRDQPVNIAAKVCKSGLAAPWQLILSRPVREDAYQNLPERDEFKWVCLGRKPVPGEPEPLELWDFQDVQQKSEHRTLVYIDYKKVAEALRNLPAISAQFNERLNELVGEVIARRTEEPWLLPVDGPAGGAMGLAFKDPVEAIQGAIDLRETATKEQWERILTGFKRASRDDNLLKIAVTGGQVRLTYEDGLIREFKGAALEAARPLVGVAENSQIIVQRELKEAVAAAFPESDVKWKKVEAAALGDEPAIDAFELRRGSVRNHKPMLIGVGIFALAAAITLGIAVPKMWGTRPITGPWAPGTPPPEISSQVRSLEAILPAESVTAIQGVLTSFAARDYKNVDDINKVREGFADVDAALKAITARNASTGFNIEAAKEFASKLPGDTKEQVVTWLGEFIKQSAIPVASDPIAGVLTKERDLKALEERIKASKAADQAALLQEYQAVSAKVEAARKMRWTEATKDLVTKSVDEAKAAYTALAKKVPDTEEATVPGDPAWLQAAVGSLIQSDEPTIKSLGRLVGTTLRRSVEQPGAKERADTLAGPLADIAKSKNKYDLDALEEFIVIPLRGKSQDGSIVLADLDTLPTVIASTQRAAGQDIRPEIAAAERRTIALRTQYEQTGHTDEATIKAFDSLRTRLAAATQLRWIKRDETELKAAKAEADKILADGSDLQKKVAAAIALAGATQNASANLAALLGERDIAPGFASINDQWRKSADALAAKKDKPASATLEEATKLKSDLVGVAEKMKERPEFGAAPWQTALATAVRKQRDDALRPALEKVGTPAFAAGVDAADAAYKSALTDAKSFAGTVSALVNALDHAYVLSDTPPSSDKKVTDLAREVAGSPIVKNDPALATALSEYTQRVSALAKIDASTNPGELLQTVNASIASRPEVPVAVWRRLGDPAVLGQAQYLDALFQAQDEIGRLPGLNDAARKKELKDEVTKNIASRWSMHFGRLSDESAIRAAMIRRERVGTDADLLASLQPAARYNYKRALLELALDTGDEKKIQDAVTAFTSDPAWQSLPPNSPARTTLADLGAMGAGGGGAGGELPLSELGPATAGWKLVESTSDTATYEITSGGPRLSFVRVVAGTTPSWVCTTELSLAAGSGIISKDKLGGTFRQMYSDKGDYRGPFVWSRDALGNPRPGNTSGALLWTPSSPALGPNPYYPRGREPGPPTPDHPMNYLTPRAAMFLARAAGCRLITSAEWKAAAAMEPDAKSLAKWNLRDATFKELLDYRSADPRNKPSGTFDPDTQSFPSQPADKSTLGTDDKFLWFARVTEDIGGPKKFHHLVGNVAEMVYEDADKAEQIKRNDVSDLVTASDANAKFKVIGASAISGLTGGDPRPDTVLAMKLVDTDASPTSIRGFSDVGVRLAFSAKKKTDDTAPFLTRVAPIIRRAPYLPPAN